MKSPLFSTYSQGENRITSSMMAVFERIDQSVLTGILEICVGADVSFVTFTNQVPGNRRPRMGARDGAAVDEGEPEAREPEEVGIGDDDPFLHGHHDDRKGSVPDAQLRGSFNYLFETKTVANDVRPEQIKAHLTLLDGTHRHERLFIVTPDEELPKTVKSLQRQFRDKIYWFNFRAVDDAIDSVLADPLGFVPELQGYLLRELQALFEAEGLLYHADVVIVPAKDAYALYREKALYVCSPEKAFRPGLRYMAFYLDGAIQKEVATILEHPAEYVPWRQGLEAADDHGFPGESEQLEKAHALIDLLDDGQIAEDEPTQYFWLSGPADVQTEKLPGEIRNSRAEGGGRGNAWVHRPRYVSLSSLRGAKTTADVDASEQEARRPNRRRQ